MGGSAFLKSHNPKIPMKPLSHQEYTKLSALLPSLVSDHFTGIKIPVPAPEKTSYGHIDMIVHSRSIESPFKSLTAVFQASAHFNDGRVHSYVVPLAFLLGGHDTDRVETSSGEDQDPMCFQLDIESCQAELFDWRVTIQSYGDLWMIFGMMLRPFDLEISGSGLLLLDNLSDESQIDVTRNDYRRILLTFHPQKMMEYLNLDIDEYVKGFATLEEVFRWAMHCKFFRWETFLAEEKSTRIGGEWEFDHTASTTDLIAAFEMKEKWMLARFINWLQNCYGVRGPVSQDQSDEIKQATFDDALHRFQKDDECQKIVTERQERMRVNDVWRSVAAALGNPGKKRSEAMNKLKHAVASGMTPQNLRAAVYQILQGYMAPGGSQDDPQFEPILQKLFELKNVPTAL